MFLEQLSAERRHIHFVGIGGIGMSGIAEILLNLGYGVSGSDLRRSPVVERLAGLGARIFTGHDGGNVAGADAVVVSSAVPAGNPELEAARERKIPILQRGELLAELMRLKFGVAVSGSHGKTTTTSMIAAVLHSGRKDPTVVVGGRAGAIGSNARLGKSDFLVVEADESDGSFLQLAPILAVITSIDREHLDHYGAYETLRDSFVAFANKTPFYGAVIVAHDDPGVQEILPRIRRTVRTYGTSPEADLSVCDLELGGFRSSFRLRHHGRDLGVFEVQAAGFHNVLNAMAAVLTGLELEIPAAEIREGLAGYRGVDRRFQVVGREGGVTVIDDYGHHPSEIAATLAAARRCGFGRIHVIFQPHRYTRTQLLAEEFTRCFGDCDQLYVLDIYAAGEKPIDGVNAKGLAERIAEQASLPAGYCPSMEAAIEEAAARARPGDAVLTLGAGDISHAGPKVLAKLAGRGSETRVPESAGRMC